MSAKFYMLASLWVFLASGSLMAQDQNSQNAQNAATEPQQVAAQPVAKQVPEESKVAEVGADFNQEFAFNHLKAICDIGPRMSTSQGMASQQAMLKKHFEALGAQVGFQNFAVNDPRKPGQKAQLSNLVVRFHKERKKRLLLCCHYDTRPFPDRDPVNPQGVFLGANDGASGAAFLCEMGRHMPNLEGPLGFDFIFFDGEEFVYTREHPMFLGSEHFAREYAARNWDVKYDYAVLVDMIGDKQLQLKMEVNSLNMARDLTKMIWTVAKDLKVREFRATKGHTIKDDHLPLNQIARIPTCDIIDFDYPNPRMKNRYWHTTMDSVENCSAASLGKVGKVMLEWSRQMQVLYDKNAKKKSRTANRRNN